MGNLVIGEGSFGRVVLAQLVAKDSDGSLITEEENSTEVWKIDIPRLPHQFTGTGDLFSVTIEFTLHF